MFDEILPAYHTQQQTLQLQSIAHHNSVPLASLVTPLSTPSVSSVALPAVSPAITPVASSKRPSEMPLTPAASVDENPAQSSTSDVSNKRSEAPSTDESAEPEPPKKKRRAALTRVGDLGS